MEEVTNNRLDPDDVDTALEVLGVAFAPATGILTLEPGWWAMRLLVAPCAAPGVEPAHLPNLVLDEADGNGALITMLAVIENVLSALGRLDGVRAAVERERLRLAELDRKYKIDQVPKCVECRRPGKYLPDGRIVGQHEPGCSRVEAQHG